MNTLTQKVLTAALIVFSLGGVQQVFADIAIIVHPSNSTADVKTIKRIFLGKVKAFDDGADASPVELPEGDAVRSAFNSGFLKKSDAQMKSYWGRLVFTGKAAAPTKAASADDMIAKVAANPKFIGYVDASAVSDAVKVVHTF